MYGSLGVTVNVTVNVTGAVVELVKERVGFCAVVEEKDAVTPVGGALIDHE